ncbi:MAG TPA: replication initiation protein [Candidatus Babeliales bacterium]|jgi:hypothetical protein|nr:replication initiation protein [Candidatus Babeliales bacterium]
MAELKKMVKDDINFLEYPNWTISRNSKTTVFTIQKPHGKYEVYCPLGLPKQFDKIVVYFLLYKLYHEKKFASYTLKTNRYEIAQGILGGSHFSKSTYDRIMKSIKKWQTVSINFEGVFYEEEGHTIRGFAIVDEYILRKKTGELTIRFSEEYIKQLQDTKFYKLIDFEQYKRLHKTSSARLYEILVKNFKDRHEWAINIQSLAEKLTFEKREGAQNYFPSEVLRYLKPGINEINKKTDLSIKFDYNNDTGVCIFKKITKLASPNTKEVYAAAIKTESKRKQKDADNTKQIALCMKQFKSLPIEEQEKILSAISQNPFLKVLDQDSQIFAYMMNNQQ